MKNPSSCGYSIQLEVIFLRLTTVSSLFFFVHRPVAIKIIDKTQLNQGSLQKVSKQAMLIAYCLLLSEFPLTLVYFLVQPFVFVFDGCLERRTKSRLESTLALSFSPARQDECNTRIISLPLLLSSQFLKRKNIENRT